ncbi:MULTISPECIES: hypothetical protein [unclassified Rhizobium]|uniref:hypothetical protein n=1 Tax=unclassified Rhizobium TaxID=2613769 RepID=UPI000BE992C4|nr:MULTISPECIES: hypothetical protein [unclassified Rhizobium]MDF0659728.1 hypothetical protein [Rhizobium sp. BC49]PDS85257.1 hypothetical protein CO654_12340 [Rhizobium sp. L18]
MPSFLLPIFFVAAAAVVAEPDPLTVRDLVAQESMAFWAALMFWLTLAGTLVAGAGLVFVYLTLRETRIMADRQLRPYLYFEEGSITTRVDGDGRLWLSTEVVFKNGGVTPAILTDQAIQVVAIPGGPNANRLGGGSRNQVTHIIGNGKTFSVTHGVGMHPGDIPDHIHFNGGCVVGIRLQYNGRPSEETWLYANVQTISDVQNVYPLRFSGRPDDGPVFDIPWD